MLRSLSLILALTIIAGPTLVAADLDLGRPPGGGEESLLFESIPVVFTAAKKEQLATEAPSSITVITAEDIRRSGADSIPDVLRQVVGLDVFEPTASQWEVNARGINHALNPRMLVLVDGRTVYHDFYGGVIWYLLPVVLEDIERIEVVRGPGSALYGANAISGVINIITKSVQAAAGLEATVVRGGDELERTNVVYGNPTASVPYKVTAAVNHVDEWDREARSGRVGKLNLLLEPKVAGRGMLTVAAGLDQGVAQVPINNNSLVDWHEHAHYLVSSYEHGDYSVRAFWNHNVGRLSRADECRHVTENVLDLEAQASRQWGKHAVIMGAGVRQTVVKSPDFLDQRRRSENLQSLFVEDEYRPTSRFTLVGGARYDHTTLLGGRVSPRLSAIYRFDDRRLARLSVGKAFRRPTFVESYLWYAVPVMPGVDYVLHGNHDTLDPEVLTSYELEFRDEVSKRLRLTAEVYRWKLEGFILNEDVSRLETTYTNQLDMEATGLELAGEFLLTTRLSGFANATWERVKDPDTEADLDGVPAQKYNAGLRYNGPRNLQADLYFHHVATSRWLSKDTSDAYTLVNARLGYALHRGDVEVALAVFNLLDDRHHEFVQGQEIGRRITGTVHWCF